MLPLHSIRAFELIGQPVWKWSGLLPRLAVFMSSSRPRAKTDRVSSIWSGRDEG